MTSTQLAPATAGADRDVEQGTVAILLAGGQGSRLHELTSAECKPALPFVHGLRIVDFTMAGVVRAGLSDVVACTQFAPRSLEQHLERVWAPRLAGQLALRHGPAITGADGGYEGTASAVFHNIGLIDQLGAKRVVVLAADHICRMDIRALIAAHCQVAAPATVACLGVPLDKATGFGVFQAGRSGLAVGFAEKPADPQGMPSDPAMALASMGIYVFDWPWLREKLIADAMDPQSTHDFGNDILPGAVEAGQVNLWRFEDHGTTPYWRDVGTLDAFRDAALDFLSDRKPFPIDDMPGVNLAPDATGDHVVAGTVILPGASVAPGAHVCNAIVAAGAQVPDGVLIGVNAEQDRRRYRVSDGGTILVTAKMLAGCAPQRAETPTVTKLPLWVKRHA